MIVSFVIIHRLRPDARIALREGARCFRSRRPVRSTPPSLDEPMSSLDARLKTRLIPYLKRIRDEFRIPLIYVTHDSSELGALCDEVLIVESERIIQRGLATTVLNVGPP